MSTLIERLLGGTGEETASISPVPVDRLVQLWRKGDHMAVAVDLMFKEASYVEFVYIVHAIGHEDGLRLGALLDELADAGGEEPPTLPDEYRNVTSGEVASEQEENVL